MPRVKLNEDMVRRIESALDERKQKRRRGEGASEQPDERRRTRSGRRDSDREPPANS
jgi:hypothetical protein